MTDDPFIKYFLLPVFILIAAALCWMIPQLFAERDRRIQHAASIGCEYIGQARDLNSVAFYDCNGVIRMERVK